MDHPPFEDLTSEVTYWRQKAEEYRQAMEDAREELEDFQTSSRELELELETQLEQMEKRNRELIVATERLSSERDEYKGRAESGQNFLNSEVTQLQEELSKLKSEKDKMQRYIRELEQTNDDLERSKRAAIVSLEDFEARLNQSIERNAILKNELEEKEDLLVTVQRLKDEVRGKLIQSRFIARPKPSLIRHKIESELKNFSVDPYCIVL
ncbi:Nuclear distribution protein nudE 1-B [Fasciola gigantica]|uniref:Nuclear distribution protein nudE 1-B n=1 Tax=Fasciola gigantica TaxID=46835 RepID=A0A504Z669_FASGI|nr:Nuclear distribution protein nudE 1-B [Fasciola gigantica]